MVSNRSSPFSASGTAAAALGPGRVDPLHARDHADVGLRRSRHHRSAHLLITVRPPLSDEYERVGALTIDAYRALPVDHLWGGYDERILDTLGRARGADVLVAVNDDGVVVHGP